MHSKLTRRSAIFSGGAVFASPVFQSYFLESGPMPFTPKFVDLVRNLTSVTGTGPVTLGQAVNGYTSLAAAVSAGDQFYYTIQGVDKPQEREVGRGTMQSDGKVARAPVGGTATNFTTGNKTIALVAAAEWFSRVDQAGAGLGAAGNRSELAARDGSSAGRAFLAETGRAGNFTFDPSDLSARVSADPAQGIYVAPATDASGATGAWVRRFDGPVNVRWFGAAGDGTTDDGPAFVAALALLSAIAANDDGAYKGSPRLYIPPGPYYLGATTLDITHTLIIEGDGTGHSDVAAKLRWAANTTGIRIQGVNTSGSGSVGASQHSGASTMIRRLWLVGGYTEYATEVEYHGIHTKAAVIVEDCRIENFQGDGFFARASAGAGAPDEGNANVMSVHRVRIDNCRNGVYVDGSDVNAGHFAELNLNYNRQWGVWDSSFLGNSYTACHAAGSGQSAAGLTPTQVSHNGNRYSPVFGQEAGASVNAPSGTAADNPWWYFYAPGAPAADRSIPAWSSGMTLRSGGAYLMEQAANVMVGCYAEQDQGVTQLQTGSICIGGLMGSGVKGFGTYLRSALNYTTVDKLQVMLDTVFAGQAVARGEWAFNGPNLYDGKIFSNDGTRALVLDGQNYVSITIGGGFTGNFQSSGLDLAAGKTISINGNQLLTARQTGTPADASDLATAIILLNAIKAKLVAHGLIS